jgi:hypothetical protein
MINKAKWLQWEHKDGNHLSGRSVFELLQPLVEIASPGFVMVEGLDGAVFALRDAAARLSISDFMSQVSDADQYDWAFFFFFKEGFEDIYEDMSELSMIEKSYFTVRLADSNYFYVYSSDEKLNEYIFSVVNSKECKNVDFKDLEIMY